MAKAKKLPSGQWRTLVYSHTDEQGKRKYESFTADTRKESEYMVAEFALNKKSKKNCSKYSELTFGEALDDYIAKRESILSPRSIVDYKRIRRNSIQELMDIRLSDITQDIIQDVVNNDSKIHAPKTVRNNHGLISAVLKQYRPEMALNTALPKKSTP